MLLDIPLSRCDGVVSPLGDDLPDFPRMSEMESRVFDGVMEGDDVDEERDFVNACFNESISCQGPQVITLDSPDHSAMAIQSSLSGLTMKVEGMALILGPRISEPWRIIK